MEKTREDLINNYILTVQILFNFLVIIILFKYFQFGFLNFQGIILIVFVFLIVFLVISIQYISVQRQNKYLDFFMIFVDIILINILIIQTNLYEARFLYLIPIIIVAIKYPLVESMIFTSFIGIYNFSYDYIYLKSSSMNYNIETDLILLGIFLILNWLIGNLVQVESDVRKSLHKTNEILVKNKALLEKIVNEMPLCLIVIDQNENIVLINQPALDIVNINNQKAEQFVGKKFEVYFNRMYSNSSRENALLIKSLYHGKSYFKEKVIRNNRILEVTCRPIFDQKGKINFVLSIFYDITSEEILNENISNLEKLNTIGQMAATIAHEIKNPLTTIKGFLQLALRSKESLEENRILLLISEIERCKTIINDFLSVGKKSPAIKERCNLKDIIEGHIPLIEKDALFNNINLRLELTNVPDLMLNSSEIKQLILNLSRNAIEAMDNGGILTIMVREDSENIILKVEDQGHGISPDILEKIGTPFITTKEKGTGLGLSVCYRIAEKHGARILIDSEEGGGTKIKVLFPKNL